MNKFVKVEALQGRFDNQKETYIKYCPEETWNIDVDKEKGEINWKKN